MKELLDIIREFNTNESETVKIVHGFSEDGRESIELFVDRFDESHLFIREDGEYKSSFHNKIKDWLVYRFFQKLAQQSIDDLPF